MSILTVGIGQSYATLAAAVAASGSFDTINVLAGTYTDDFTTITHPLSINAVGGLASFVAAASPPNGKAIMTVQADLSLNGLEFSGAAVPDGNGAGIRFEAGNLSISNSWFHDNQNGILTAPGTTATLTISHSEFNDNGSGTGFTHNIYVNDIASLTITGSYFHDVIIGHQIKSRAETNIITGNIIADGPAGTGSYSIDLPNGGANTITGNTFEKGPNSQNSIYIAIGEEGGVHPGTTSQISGNIFINDIGAGGIPYALKNQSGGPATLADNTFYGFGGATNAIGATGGQDNTFQPLPGPAYDTSHPFLPPAVPEPMSGALLLPMLAAVVALRRWRRRHHGRGAMQPIPACMH
jgi:hypothetical protein